MTGETRHGVRQGLVLALALAQVVMGLAMPASRPAGEAGGAPVRGLIQPVDLTFAIWLPIFVACIAHAALALRRGHRARPLVARIAWPLAGAFASTALFEAAVALGWFERAQIFIATLLVSSGLAYRTVVTAPREEARAGDGVFIGLPVGLLFGWSIAASLVTVGALARWVSASALAELALSTILLLLGGLAASLLIWRGRRSSIPGLGLSLGAAIAWAYLGVAAGTVEIAPLVAALAVTCLVAVLATSVAPMRSAPPGSPGVPRSPPAQG